jgi:hypothetical protein
VTKWYIYRKKGVQALSGVRYEEGKSGLQPLRYHVAHEWKSKIIEKIETSYSPGQTGTSAIHLRKGKRWLWPKFFQYK